MHLSFLFKTVSTFLLCIAMIAFNFSLCSSRLSEDVLVIANMQLKKMATLVINKTILENLNNDIKNVSFITVENNVHKYNVEAINYLLFLSSNEIYNNLRSVELGNSELLSDDEVSNRYQTNAIIYEIPFSLISDNPFLASLGPKIPVKFSLIGDIKTDCVSTVSSFGLNNAMIELSMKVQLTFKAIIPLISEASEIEVLVPFSISVLEGKIPEYYLGSYNIEGVTATYSNEVKL